jgi:hypothetical protein
MAYYGDELAGLLVREEGFELFNQYFLLLQIANSCDVL